MFLLVRLVAFFTLLGVCTTGCAPAVQSPEAAAVNPVEVSVETQPAETSDRLHVAAFFPWTIVDGDFNNIGYVALLTVQSQLDVDTTYLQAVDPADLSESMRAMVEQDYTILWAHGSQFLEPALEFARANPEVIVIVEDEVPLPQRPRNVWVIDRNFHAGYYVLGALAARATQTGQVAYLAGLPMTYSLYEAHAAEQAIQDSGLPVSFQALWTQDLNDADLARRETDRLIAGGVDFILSSLNQGTFGTLEAAKSAEGKVLVTSKYSDKSPYAPNHHVTALLYDFAVPLAVILTQIESGKTGGVYTMQFGNGISLSTPLANVDPSLQDELEEIIAKIQGGEIEVRQDASPFP